MQMQVATAQLQVRKADLDVETAMHRIEHHWRVHDGMGGAIGGEILHKIVSASVRPTNL